MEGAPVQVGELVAGKLRVERVLGEGGMGVVVAARHEELDQRVAVKFLLPDVAKRADAAERFRREARAAAKIRSEHVARVLDVGTTENGVTYMVMEYLDGNDVSVELQRRGPLPVEEAVGLVLQASEAVAEAHAAGIVHRDLKPANLFLATRTDGSRMVKVLDFGISKSVSGSSLTDLSLTNTSALIGSPLYMSPEQMTSAKSVDARTDIWALGAILYQLLAGRPPYVADSLPMLCSALLNESPPSLPELRPEVSSELAAAIGKALSKDRTERWQTIAEFALALAPFADSARVHAERAARLLGASASQPSLQATAPIAPTPLLASGDLASAIETGTEPTVLAGSEPGTLDSWGKTRAGQESAQSRRKLSALVLGALVAGSLVTWGVLKTSAKAQPSASPATEAPAAVLAPASAPEAIGARPGMSPVDRTAPDAGAPALVEPAAPDMNDAAPERKAAASRGSPRPAAKPTGPSQPKDSPQKPKAPSLPDFGGRR